MKEKNYKNIAIAEYKRKSKNLIWDAISNVPCL